MSYLIDTNALSEWRKTSPDRGVANWFAQASLDQLYVSVITLGEIRRGIAGLQRRRDHVQATRYDTWLDQLKVTFADRIIPVTPEIADEWGILVAYHQIAASDGLIAATARIGAYTLVTRNVKDFGKVGVRLVNPFVG